MKHLLTTLLLLFTLTLTAQEETSLLGKNMNRIVEIEGEYDKYGTEDGDPYIKYYAEDFNGATLYFFNTYGLCNRIYLLVEKSMEFELRRLMNNRYAMMEEDKWLDIRNQAYLYLIEMDNKLVVRIVKR